MKRIIWITAVGMVAIGGACIWSRPPAGEASPQASDSVAAVEKARNFLRTIEMPVPADPPRVTMRPSRYLGDSWNVAWGGVYWFVIDARSGSIRIYNDSGRVDDQVKRRYRTGHRVITSKQVAEGCARELATKLGLPRDAVVEKLDVIEDDDPAKTDANKIGNAVVIFCPRPHGYPFLHRRNGMTLVIDRQDGRLVEFFQNWDVEIESHDRRTTQAAAVSTATDAYEGHYGTRRGFRRGKLEGSKAPVLGYVVPDGTFTGRSLDPIAPFKARLAWEVYFGGESVWIDAGDGSVLGGVLLR